MLLRLSQLEAGGELREPGSVLRARERPILPFVMAHLMHGYFILLLPNSVVSLILETIR